MGVVECVDDEQIIRSAEVILQLAEKTSKLDLTQPLEEKPVVLQVGFKKIPSVQNQVIKILLPVAITHGTTDVCLFTKDLDKTNRDHEPTIRHYRELLDVAGVKQKIDIIPYKCLVLEYQPYEAKRHLSNMYDVFLADERIVHRLPTLIGKNFLARKKYPIRVNLTSSSLKREIEKALSTTQCVVTGRGSTCQVTVARTGMTAEQIAKNVKAAITRLTDSLPGGPDNIRNIHIKTPDSPSIPVYISFDKRDGIKLPKKKAISQELQPEEVTTVENALVKITKSGHITLIKEPNINTSGNDENTTLERDSVNEVNDEISSEETGEETVETTDEESLDDDSLPDETLADDHNRARSKRTRLTAEKPKLRKKRSTFPDQRGTGEELGSDEEPGGKRKVRKSAEKKILKTDSPAKRDTSGLKQGKSAAKKLTPGSSSTKRASSKRQEGAKSVQPSKKRKH